VVAVVPDDPEAGFFLMNSLRGLRMNGGGGGGAGGGGGGLSFCSATSSLFTKSTSINDVINHVTFNETLERGLTNYLGLYSQFFSVYQIHSLFNRSVSKAHIRQRQRQLQL